MRILILFTDFSLPYVCTYLDLEAVYVGYTKKEQNLWPNVLEHLANRFMLFFLISHWNNHTTNQISTKPSLCCLYQKMKPSWGDLGIFSFCKKKIYLSRFSQQSRVSLLLQTMIIVKYNMYLSLRWIPNRMTRTIWYLLRWEQLQYLPCSMGIMKWNQVNASRSVRCSNFGHHCTWSEVSTVCWKWA